MRNANVLCCFNQSSSYVYNCLCSRVGGHKHHVFHGVDHHGAPNLTFAPRSQWGRLNIASKASTVWTRVLLCKMHNMQGTFVCQTLPLIKICAYMNNNAAELAGSVAGQLYICDHHSQSRLVLVSDLVAHMHA